MSRLLSQNIRGPSKLHLCHLDDAKTRACLIQFGNLIGSCRGPNGKVKMIQNKVGGHLTLTSSSSRLLASMSFTHPILQIIVGSTQNHLANYKDGGLLVCHFCLLLLESSIVQTWNRHLVVEVYEKCLAKIEEYLSSSDCTCQFDISFSSIEEMMSFLHCMLMSKPLCCLNGSRLDHLSKTILKSFLNSVPENTDRTFFSDRMYIQCILNCDVLDTRSEKGILMSCPELSSVFEQNVELKKCVNVAGFSRTKVVLVNVSMSGDAEELMNVKYEADTDNNMEEFLLSAMLKMCGRLVECGVGMVLSQKVMHPQIKLFLKLKGVFFIDRIGAHMMPYLRDLTGATPISSALISDFVSSSFGWLDDAVHCVINEKSYIHLRNTYSPVVSLILCSPLEEVCSELQCLCSSSLMTLKRLVNNSSVLCGGGCWQSHLAAFLRSQKDDISKEMDVPELQVSEIVENFARCLEKSATSLTQDQKIHKLDNNYHHLWKTSHGGTLESRRNVLTCSCGLLSTDQSDDLKYLGHATSEKSDCNSKLLSSLNVEKSPQILDCLATVMSALQTAVYTSNSILMTHQFIQDQS